MEKPVVRLVVCGSVDDGKSTLIGRLLVETDSVPQDTVASARTIRRTGSTVKAGDIDFSLLTDGLEAEREQGITIDVAYRSMNLLNGRRLILADAPGHEQYTRNMAVAASRSDIALVLVDATNGIRPQTLRHLTICSLMGVSQIAVVVNKLDQVDYSQMNFLEIETSLKEAINRLDISNCVFIPVSALNGDNIVSPSDHLPWYKGPTLLDFLQKWQVEESTGTFPRLNIQMVSRAENFRGVAGRVSGGRFSVLDKVRLLPSGKAATISKIVTFEGELDSAEDGRAVTIVLDPDVDATRGDVVELEASPVKSNTRYVATVVWLGEQNLVTSKSYLLISGSTQVPAIITKIKNVIRIESGKPEASQMLSTNEIGVVEISTDAPIALEPYKVDRLKGNFILVDRASMATEGAGMVVHSLRRGLNIFEQEYEISREARESQKNQKARVIWLTGISGSGKSTIANALEKKLFGLGVHSYVLDGDNLRLGLNKDLGFSRQDRAENVRRVAEVARMLYDAGLVVIVALISPYAADRAQAKSLFPQDDFHEVWVDTPLVVCQERDSKGLYKKATDGDLPNLSGVGQSYDIPDEADLVIDGSRAVEQNLNLIFEHLLKSDG